MKINIHEIKLSGEDDFAKKFNAVSDLYESIWEDGITEEEQKKRFEEYSAKKYCLEQGIG